MHIPEQTDHSLKMPTVKISMRMKNIDKIIISLSNYNMFSREMFFDPADRGLFRILARLKFDY